VDAHYHLVSHMMENFEIAIEQGMMTGDGLTVQVGSHDHPNTGIGETQHHGIASSSYHSTNSFEVHDQKDAVGYSLNDYS
jgi:hypothetical protein